MISKSKAGIEKNYCCFFYKFQNNIFSPKFNKHVKLIFFFNEWTSLMLFTLYYKCTNSLNNKPQLFIADLQQRKPGKMLNRLMALQKEFERDFRTIFLMLVNFFFHNEKYLSVQYISNIKNYFVLTTLLLQVNQ